MEYLELILSLAVTTLGLLITSGTLILKLVSAIKAKTNAENTVKLDNAIIPYIEQAEEQTSYLGAEKKEYVLSQLNIYAEEINAKPDLMSLEQKLEELIKLTKQVNCRKKDKTQKTHKDVENETVNQSASKESVIEQYDKKINKEKKLDEK